MSNSIPESLPSLSKLLRFAGHKTGDLYAVLLKDSGLTLQQWVVLTALWRQDGMTVGELAKYTHSKIAAISRIVGRMETAEFVSRKSEESDSRVVRVWMTEKSKQLDSLIDVYEKVNRILLAGFGPEEEEVFLSMLKRVIENAKSFAP